MTLLVIVLGLWPKNHIPFHSIPFLPPKMSYLAILCLAWKPDGRVSFALLLPVFVVGVFQPRKIPRPSTLLCGLIVTLWISTWIIFGIMNSNHSSALPLRWLLSCSIAVAGKG